LISGISFSQNFKVISFEEDMSDLSAVSYARTDVNDDKCAIIKVYTNLDNLYFETRLGIEGDIVNKTGEFWIYVSPKEKQLKMLEQNRLVVNQIQNSGNTLIQIATERNNLALLKRLVSFKIKYFFELIECKF
jgi:hypothetical protein